MTSNYSTIDVEEKTIELGNVNVTINTLRIYIILYNTHPLLYCKGHNSDDK